MNTKPTLHQAALLAIGGLSFFFLAASNPQCARVDDRVTAPDSSTLAGTAGQNNGVVDCVHACVDAAKAAREEEQDMHKRILKDCGGDRECKAQEDARHEVAMEQIARDLRDCIRPCHEQGGGRGGD